MKLYINGPFGGWSGPKPTLKSALKRLLLEDTQSKFQPMRCLKGAILLIGARETATNAISRAFRCGPRPLKLSAQNEQLLQPASPGRPEHKMIYDQLVASLKQIVQRRRSVRSFKDVVLVEPDPRQRAAGLRKRVLFAGMGLFFLKQLPAGRQPLRSGSRSCSVSYCPSFLSCLILKMNLVPE